MPDNMGPKDRERRRKTQTQVVDAPARPKPDLRLGSKTDAIEDPVKAAEAAQLIHQLEAQLVREMMRRQMHPEDADRAARVTARLSAQGPLPPERPDDEP